MNLKYSFSNFLRSTGRSLPEGTCNFARALRYLLLILPCALHSRLSMFLAWALTKSEKAKDSQAQRYLDQSVSHWTRNRIVQAGILRDQITKGYERGIPLS